MTTKSYQKAFDEAAKVYQDYNAEQMEIARYILRHRLLGGENEISIVARLNYLRERLRHDCNQSV